MGSEPHGGESPRSAIVFGQCDEDGYQAQLRRWEDQGSGLFADAGLTTELPASASVAADLTATNLGVCAAYAGSLSPSLAPLLKLGQAYTGPPFEVFDLHVDHLGSTRVTTDEDGEPMRPASGGSWARIRRSSTERASSRHRGGTAMCTQ